MPRRRHNTVPAVCVATAALLLLCCAAPALAKVQIAVDIGWENKFRSGKWTPLFITLQDSSPRQVIIEVYSPADRRYAVARCAALGLA